MKIKDIRSGMQNEKSPFQRTRIFGAPCWTRWAACGLTVRLTVAVPGVRLADSVAALHTDRGHCDSLRAALWAVARLHGACGRTSLPSFDSAPSGSRVAPYLLRYAQPVK